MAGACAHTDQGGAGPAADAHARPQRGEKRPAKAVGRERGKVQGGPAIDFASVRRQAGSRTMPRRGSSAKARQTHLSAGEKLRSRSDGHRRIQELEGKIFDEQKLEKERVFISDLDLIIGGWFRVRIWR